MALTQTYRFAAFLFGDDLALVGKMPLGVGNVSAGLRQMLQYHVSVHGSVPATRDGVQPFRRPLARTGVAVGLREAFWRGPRRACGQSVPHNSHYPFETSGQRP